MKKLLTCLFTLLMAVAILSPVSMRAEGEWTMRVNFEISELDRETGARYENKVATSEVAEKQTSQKFGLFQVEEGKYLNEKHDVSGRDLIGYIIDFKDKAAAEDWTEAKVTVYDEKGRYVSEYTVTPSGSWASLADEDMGDDYTVRVELLVDTQSAGTLYNKNNTSADGDDVDDRLQPVVTVVMQKTPFSSIYNSTTYSYVVNKGDNVQKLIKAGDYDNFPGWEDDEAEYYDRDKDVEYVRVYSNSLTNVTEDIEIEGNWAEDKAGLDRFAPAKDNGPVDLDGDGKISCDEYYGTTGLEWSDKLNACVVSSTGDAVVTIPNTATK